jgi:hypothetical protein
MRWASICSISTWTRWPPSASGWAKSVSRHAAVPLDPPARRADFDQMTDLAKSLREKLAGAPTCGAAGDDEHISADGTIKWLFDVGGGNASRCSSPRTTAARCACRRRPAAPWAAASAPPATRASAAT